jgi:hypothetical protein
MPAEPITVVTLRHKRSISHLLLMNKARPLNEHWYFDAHRTTLSFAATYVRLVPEPL